MSGYKKALEALAGIKISPGNKYVRELEQVLEGATPDRRAEVFETIGNYILGADAYIPIHSGVKVIDDFLAERREVYTESLIASSQDARSKVQGIVSAETSMSHSESAALEAKETQTRETYGRFIVFLVHDLLKEGIFGPKVYSKVRPAGQRDPEVELYNGMLSAIQGNQPGRNCFQDPDLDIKFSLEENHLLAKAYLENKPAPGPERVAYCIKVANSASHCGQGLIIGGSECPIESFKQDTANCPADFPRSFETTEFMYTVIDGLDKLGKGDLAEEVYMTYGKWTFQILQHGKKGFEHIDSFEERQCTQCDKIPPFCEFMSSHLEEVARGFYRSQPCPEKGDGEAHFQGIIRILKALKAIGTQDEETEEIGHFDFDEKIDGDPN